MGLHSRRKDNRKAQIGLDVKDATKKKVAFANEQPRQLEKLEKKSQKLQKRVLGLVAFLKKARKREKTATEETWENFDDVKGHAEEVFKLLFSDKNLEKTFAVEVKKCRSTSDVPKENGPILDNLTLLLAILIHVSDVCRKYKR